MLIQIYKYFFRSKPVVKMMAGVEFTSDSSLISLDEKNCTLYGRKKNVTCTNLKYCLIYNGINVDPVVGELIFEKYADGSFKNHN